MSFLKDTFFYSGSTIATQVIGFLRGITIRAILIPEILGIYNLIQVILGFVLVIDLGASSAASRELPILRGKNASDKEILVRGTVLWFSIGQSIVVGLGVIIYAFLFNDQYSRWEIIGFFIVSILLVLSAVGTCYQIFFRSAQLYRSLSKIIFVTGVFEAVGYIAGAYFWGISGLLTAVVGMSIVKIIVSVTIGYRNGISAKRHFSFKILKGLLRFGFPLRIIDYPMQYMVIADLIWVTKFMDIKHLAIYTTAKLFFTQSNQVSSTISTVFETRIIQQFGKDDSWEGIAILIKKYLYFQLLFIVPILIWFCVTFIPFILRQFLPKYLDGSSAVVYLMLGNFFIVINSGLTIPWFIKKKLISRGISNTVGFIVMLVFLGFFWFVYKKQDISYIAISVTCGYFSYFVYMLIMVGKEIWSLKEVFQILAIVIVSALWTAITVIIGNLYSLDGLPFLEDLLRTLTIGAIMLAVISPVILVGFYISDYRHFIRQLN